MCFTMGGSVFTGLEFALGHFPLTTHLKQTQAQSAFGTLAARPEVCSLSAQTAPALEIGNIYDIPNTM